MRILYLTADLGIPLDGHKGATQHVRGFVRALAGLDHEVLVVAPPSGRPTGLEVPVAHLPGPALAEAVLPRVAPRLGRALAHLWNNVAVEQALEDVLAAWQPDLVYERASPFGVAGGIVSARHGLPHVLEVNAPLAWEGARYRRQALTEAAGELDRAAYEAATLVVAVSAELADILAELGVPPGKIAVVPNGVDLERFVPDGEAERPGRPGTVVVGFVGSLKPWHGVDELVDAFRRLAADERYHLLVVGDGPRAVVVDAAARELPGRVTRRAGVAHDEVPRLLRGMDVAVAPYPPLERFYYSPLKVLEYMAAGRAIVASALGQVRDLITDGETGVLVPPGDVDALVRAVAELGDDAGRRGALGRAAAAVAGRDHGWTDRATRVLARLEAPCSA